MLLLVLSLLLPGGVAGADPASELSDAESRAATAEGEVAAAQQRLDQARAHYEASSQRAGPVAAAARTARVEAQKLQTQLIDNQRRAREEIAEAEEKQQQAESDHDEEVTTAVGVGLAALIVAGIALAWGWFRASAAVAALVGMRLVQAAALCVGGGFLLLVVGAALAAGDGLAAALGTAIVWLGIALPVALLLGRHSAEIQRGRAKPVMRRKRLPSWVGRSVAALLFLLGIGALGTALFADEPSPEPVSAQVRQDAEALTRGRGAARLAEARTEATEARQQASGPLARQRAAKVAVRTATRELRRARRRLTAAEGDARRFAARLAVLAEREARAAAKTEERELREAEEEQEEVEEGSGACDPNYSPCVPSYPPDVDCAEVGGSVSVYGTDPHGLDADGDGVGCE